MKKIININLAGRVIPIEDSAYESLQHYIDSLRRYFAHEEGRDEIINDIESRVAELMSDKIKRGAASVTDADIEEIINSMGRVEDFEKTDAADSHGPEQASSSTTASGSTATKRMKGRLYRDGSDKLLGGVCSGIASYFNVDPAIVRLIFAIITFGGFGMGILIYILLWIILPVRELDSYIGKRLFRNPEDKIIAGVAGGLGAYFNKPSWLFRLIFAAPLLLNILFGILNGFFWVWHRDVFPNIFIGSFTGTFFLAYIILWIVLPEARSPFEKMEMRGEKVDVNRIRQNVQEGMSDFKGRMQSWGEEVKESAQQFGNKAAEFANTRGKAFAAEMADTAKPVGQGIGHVIGVLFKAFFIFVAGCIALALFAALMALIFGGVAWWPINNFLWTSTLQKLLAWGTLLFFFAVPLIAFIVWLIRRVVRVRSRNRYLGWIFGGLWTVGWICAISFAVSIAKDLRSYERVESEVPVRQDLNKLVVKVNEPEIRYGGGIWWLREDNAGWDITEDSIRYNNVKIRTEKSEDSFYHVIVYKYSAGRNLADAQQRAEKTVFNYSTMDSVLYLGSGIGIDKASKFRGQGVIVEIQIPVNKMIRFDDSIIDAYNPWVVRRSDRDWGRRWSRRYSVEWDGDEHLSWKPNVDYIMTDRGTLRDAGLPVQITPSVEKTNVDSLQRVIDERNRQNEEDRRRLEQLREQGRTSAIEKKKTVSPISLSFVPVII